MGGVLAQVPYSVSEPPNTDRSECAIDYTNLAESLISERRFFVAARTIGVRYCSREWI